MSTKGEKTNEFILDISYGLFAKKGFKQVTMKDVCDATDMSRGGLYSHFSSTSQIFEALLERMTEKDVLDFDSEISKGTSAVNILSKAFALLENEMKHPEDSLSTAMYEYAETVDSSLMEDLNKASEKKWSKLIRYGIKTGEFKDVNVNEMVSIILYSYQGVRMWSRVIPMKQKTIHSIVENIKKQLIIH